MNDCKCLLILEKKCYNMIRVVKYMIYFNKQKYEINLNNENYHLIDKDTKQVKISCFTDLIQLDEDEWLYIKEVS